MAMFSGTYTAMVTPFRNGHVDEDAFERLIKAQIKGGVDGIVPAGTTGEAPTLTVEEHIHVIELAVRCAGKKIKVLAGTGANATEEAIHLTQAAERAGADGSLQVAPYYNKPSQEGVFQHFLAVARATKLPLVLYSIPGRCGIEIAVPTIARLVQETKTIVGLKEAGGNVDRISQLRDTLGDHFTLLCGDDALTLPFLAVGAQGVVSVASNLIPREVANLVKAFNLGKVAAAQKLHAKYYPLFKDLFLETNPVPVKAALAMLDQIDEEYRLPLVKMSAKNRETLAATLRACGLLE